MNICGYKLHVKRIGKYPPITMGIELSVCQFARRLGLNVPRTIELSGDAIGSEIVPEAESLDSLSKKGKLLCALSDRALLNLAKLAVFDYCVGCVNIADGLGGLLRDVDDYPCYSERHNGNVLWDGSEIWYIDYGHVFGRTAMLFWPDLCDVQTTLSNTIPAHEVYHSFLEQFSRAGSFKEEAVDWIRRVYPVEFYPNIWLNDEITRRMIEVFLARRMHL